MSDTLRAAARLALEALENERYVSRYTHIGDAIAALRAALAEPAVKDSLTVAGDTLPPLPEPARIVVYNESKGYSAPMFTADQMRSYAAAALAAAVAEPVAISVVAVAEVVDREDGPDLNWLLEGGIYELPAGVVLLMSDKPLTDADGHGHVYAAPPQREPYDQTALGLCNACGWKAVGPDGCLNCAPQREPQWVPVAERLPPSGQTVLACYVNRAGRLRRIRAEWIAAKSVESNSEGSDIGVYDEATDTFYDPEGWYERIDNWGDYSAVGVCEGDVTHWMPLPDAPASAPKDAQ